MAVGQGERELQGGLGVAGYAEGVAVGLAGALAEGAADGLIGPDGAFDRVVDDDAGALGDVVALAQAAACKQIRHAALQPRAQLGQWVALYEMQRT